MATALDSTDEVLATRALGVDGRVLEPVAVTGTSGVLAERSTEDASEPEAELITSVADRLLLMLNLASGDEAGVELRHELVDVLRRVTQVEGRTATPDPIAGLRTTGGLCRLLRLATASPTTGPMLPNEVQRLASAVPTILGSLAADGVFPLRQIYEVAIDPGALAPAGTDERNEAARTDDEQEARLLEEGDAYPADEDDRTPDQPLVSPGATSAGAAAAAPFAKITRFLSRDMWGLLRGMRKATRAIVDTAHSSDEGDLAHRVIQGHYLLTHPGEAVLVDDNVRTAAKSFAKLADLTSPVWKRVQQGLTVAGFVGHPDILNATRREVYEIKPLNQMLIGATQLWARYLIPLNTAAALESGSTRAAVAAFLRTIGIDGAAVSQPPWPDPWLPGSEFSPAPAYVLPDGEVIMAALVAPGLIVYQYARTKKQHQEALGLDPRRARRFLAHYSVAALLAGCGLRGRRQASGGATPNGLEEAMALATAFGVLNPEQVGLVGESALLDLLVALLVGVVVAAAVLVAVVLLVEALAAAGAVEALVVLAELIALRLASVAVP